MYGCLDPQLSSSILKSDLCMSGRVGSGQGFWIKLILFHCLFLHMQICIWVSIWHIGRHSLLGFSMRKKFPSYSVFQFDLRDEPKIPSNAANFRVCYDHTHFMWLMSLQLNPLTTTAQFYCHPSAAGLYVSKVMQLHHLFQSTSVMHHKICH